MRYKFKDDPWYLPVLLHYHFYCWAQLLSNGLTAKPRSRQSSFVVDGYIWGINKPAYILVLMQEAWIQETNLLKHPMYGLIAWLSAQCHMNFLKNVLFSPDFK